MAGPWGGYKNGRIPSSALVGVGQGTHALEPNAAAAFLAMRADASRSGVNLLLLSSYRSFDAQVATKLLRGDQAADPGSSDHGYGQAFDAVDNGSREWIQTNGVRFNWVWPAWARPGGSNPEPWHFVFVGSAVSTGGRIGGQIQSDPILGMSPAQLADLDCGFIDRNADKIIAHKDAYTDDQREALAARSLACFNKSSFGLGLDVIGNRAGDVASAIVEPLSDVASAIVEPLSDVASAIVEPLSDIAGLGASLIRQLLDPQFWLRVGFLLGGLIVLVLAVRTLNQALR